MPSRDIWFGALQVPLRALWLLLHKTLLCAGITLRGQGAGHAVTNGRPLRGVQELITGGDNRSPAASCVGLAVPPVQVAFETKMKVCAYS